jgi:hypothetical protein
MTTIGESIARVRGIIKASSEDAFITDRFVYGVISKYAKMLLKEKQDQRKLMQQDELFEFLPFEKLKEVDKIEADCSPIKSNCIILRTELKLPKVFSGSTGPLIRKVYSIDGGYEFHKTSPVTYISIKNKSCNKHDKNHYYFYKNGHLYFPDSDVEAIMIEALWEDTLEGRCTLGEDDENKCNTMQDRKLPLPDYLFAKVEQMAEQEFGMTMRVPSEGADDGQNVLR